MFVGLAAHNAAARNAAALCPAVTVSAVGVERRQRSSQRLRGCAASTSHRPRTVAHRLIRMLSMPFPGCSSNETAGWGPPLRVGFTAGWFHLLDESHGNSLGADLVSPAEMFCVTPTVTRGAKSASSWPEVHRYCELFAVGT